MASSPTSSCTPAGGMIDGALRFWIGEDGKAPRTGDVGCTQCECSATGFQRDGPERHGAKVLDVGFLPRHAVVLGHVAPKPWRSAEAENALKGKTISEAVAAEAGKAAVAAATPLSKNKHKVQLASVAVKRAILKAAGVSA